MSLLAVHSPIITAVGWAIISFLWQALLIHGALLLVLRCVPVARSNARYLISLLALAALVITPVATVGNNLNQPVAVPSGLTGIVRVPHPQANGSSSTDLEAAGGNGPLAGIRTAMALGWPVNVQVLMGKVTRYLPVVVLIWILGVALSLGRLAGDIGAVQRLGRERVHEPPPWLADLVAKLGKPSRKSAPVLMSELVSVPMVIGTLKPLVLVPTSVLTGLTPRQLELIIAHELEHVWRFDPVINQVQCVIQAVFFFHPSVSALNRVVRQEREHRTDAQVAQLAGGGQDYAAALGQLARVALVTGPHLAATGGNLSNRVRRVLGVPEEPTSKVAGAIALAAFGLLLVVGAALASPGPGDLTGQIIANPGIIQQLTDEDMEQLLRQTVDSGAEEQEKLLELLLLVAARVAEDHTLTALFIVNADLLSAEQRLTAREALFTAQRDAAMHDSEVNGPPETYEIHHNTEPNYASYTSDTNLILPSGFDLNRASLSGWQLDDLPAGRSLLYVRNHVLLYDGLDRARLLESLDLSEVTGLPSLDPATFGVLLTKFPNALQGANRFSNPDFTLAELLELDDLSSLDGPWSLWVDDGNVVTRNTSVPLALNADGTGVTSPTPPQFLCLEDGIVVGGLSASKALASADVFERIYSDCLSGAWGTEWNPIPPSIGGPVPAFPLVSQTGDQMNSETLNGVPTLLAFLSPIEEPPIVVAVGRSRRLEAPEPSPALRVRQLQRLIAEADSDARLSVVAVPYYVNGASWTSRQVADELRTQLDIPVFESPYDTIWLDLSQYRISAGTVVLLDGNGRLVDVFHDFNRLEATADWLGRSLSDALSRLAGVQ